MSDRFAYLYGLIDRFDLRALVDELSISGITLSNPGSGRVTALNEDGDQIDVTLDILVASMATNHPLTFQFWMPDHADVCCRVRHLGDSRLVEEYSLVGLHLREKNHVINALVERFSLKARQEEESLFFVGDPHGHTIDVDWDLVSLEGSYEGSVCPDFLGIPQSRLVDFRRCEVAGHDSGRVGGYLILSKSPPDVTAA